MKSFLLHISRGTIHNGISPCSPAKRMAESNKKWFDNYLDAENYYEGSKKGTVCSCCFKSRDEAIEFEKQMIEK